MKTPDTSKPVSSAPQQRNFIGNFPKQRHTVMAEVLMQLLKAARLSGMDAVFDASTTRLAVFIHSLKRKHRWDIDHTDEVIPTSDGRVTEIRRYHLSQDVIDTAMQAGGREFCESVADARAKLRQSPQALPAKPQ